MAMKSHPELSTPSSRKLQLERWVAFISELTRILSASITCSDLVISGVKVFATGTVPGAGILIYDHHANDFLSIDSCMSINLQSDSQPSATKSPSCLCIILSLALNVRAGYWTWPSQRQRDMTHLTLSRRSASLIIEGSLSPADQSF
jgi:hypothetical protein